MPFREQIEQIRKPRPEEARNTLKARGPESRSPGSRPRALSIQVTFSKERSELGISAPEIIWGNFTQTSGFPGLGFRGRGESF